MARTTGQRRPPRLAEDVANRLRQRILSGEFSNGDCLPIQEDLVVQYRVSLPSVREALRVLETEGLISVQRGKIGGSIVHVPQTAKVAYMLGLVLESRSVEVDELVFAISQIEPLCVRACALRSDRAEAVVPVLERIHQLSVDAVNDAPVFARLARQFHEELVASCGNQPFIVLVGALELLWSGQVQAVGVDIEFGALPERTMRSQSNAEHRELLDFIIAGDADLAEASARKHQADPHRHTLLGRALKVSAEPLRQS